MIEERGLGGKRINRVNVSLTNMYDSKLHRLATACNMKPTTLAGLILETSLDDVQVVNKLQDEYCTQRAYKVVLVQRNGVIHYTLTGREDI
jgi:hypothetical protein